VQQGHQEPKQQAPEAAPPFYASAPPLVQPSHNEHLEQVPEQNGLDQQAPVPAVEESAVKRGKRKAVDLDDNDCPPRKRQMVHYYPDFEIVESRGEARYRCCLSQCENTPAVRQSGIQEHIRSRRHQMLRARLVSPELDEAVNRADSSNIGGSYAKNQQEAQEVSQRPCEDSTLSQPLEYFSDNFEDTTDFTLNESFEEPFNSLDGTVDSVTEEQVKELFSLLTKDADWTSDEQVEEAVNNLEVTADSASGEQSVFANSSEDTVNPQLLSQTDNSASNESLEDYINSVGETFDQASGGQLKEFATDEEALDDFFKILYEALN
jgi:hypothetical protein